MPVDESESDDSIFIVAENDEAAAAAFNVRLVAAGAPVELPLGMGKMWLSIAEAPVPLLERVPYVPVPGAPQSKLLRGGNETQEVPSSPLPGPPTPPPPPPPPSQSLVFL